ncbi:hypothetical protein [Luteitalea pratensis]|uniref:hypothetical protein n=1 Tax=Luteitalea pratensis TaxID=1855912 RepID=UPI000D7273B1|nr:hypothetical protein [Luteitalea pratensis]
MSGLFRRVLVSLLLLVLPVSSVGACGGWEATPEGRMACCAHHESCAGAASRSHVTSQASADSCCASSEQRPVEQASHAVVASMPAPAAVEPLVAPETPPVTLLSPAALDLPAAAVERVPRHVLLVTFLI